MYKTGTFVPSSKPKKNGNGLAFLGESPGTKEKQKGVVFSGPSGQLLDEVLKTHNIKREETLLTNAALCNYKDEDKASLPGAIDACRPRLLAELKESKVTTAVTLGNAAVSSLLETKTGITKLRGGEAKDSTYVEGLKVVPTFHPAFCLRDQGKFPLMLADVGKIKPKQATWVEPEIHVICDSSRALRVLTSANTEFPYVLDVETGKEKEAQYSRTTNLLCVGLGSTKPGHNNRVIVIGRPAIYDPKVKDALISLVSKTGVICQNGKFDTYILHTINRHDLPIYLVADTMLQSYCLAPDTKTLRTDLTWDTVNNLKPGDELVGFDENSTTNQLPTFVKQVSRQQAPTYKITTSRGSVVSSANHKWPVMGTSNNVIKWRTTQWLAENGTTHYRIPFLATPWEVDSSYEGGYIAGILDGEGCLSKKANAATHVLSYAQNDGPVADYAAKILADKGFILGSYRNEASGVYHYLFKGQEALLRALGMFRPKRLMQKSDLVWQGKRKRQPAYIESIEYQGVQEVVGVETTTGTLIANGLLTHNSLNENPGTHSLGYMGIELLGTPDWKDVIKPYLKAPQDKREIRGPALEYLRSTLTDNRQRLRTEVIKNAPVNEAPLKRAAKELGVIEEKGQPGEPKAAQIRWRIDPDKEIYLATEDADGSYASIPPEILHKYNAFDVQVCRQLYEVFKDQQAAEGLTGFNDHLMVMSNALMRVERNGLQLDYDFNQTLYDQFTEYISKLAHIFPDTLNPNSPVQLLKFIEDSYGYPLDSTGEEVITAYLHDDKITEEFKEFCQGLLEYRRWTKLRSTYVTSIRKLADENDGRVLPTFKIDQATTGRLASKNPNVQNMPRQFDIKRQFVPSSKDHVFVHADYSQLELRVITWLAQDEGMRALFNDPERDVFDELALYVYGYTKEQWQELKATNPKQAKEYRVVVKSFAYGIAYGRTPQGIAQDPDLDISVDEAVARYKIFSQQIPTILSFQKEVIRRIHRGEDLVNVFGRHRRFHLITNQNKHDLEKQAMAYLPQSTASDICVTALSRLPSHFDPRNIIHDAILIECPRDEAAEQGKELVRIMIDTAEEITGGYVKFDVDYDIGDTWADV